MNSNEMNYFFKTGLPAYDVTEIPITTLLKSIYVKCRRKTWGRFMDKDARFLWTVSAVTDAVGPAYNVRNYIERNTIRRFLKYISTEANLTSACEIGCGYGRVIMVLREYAAKVIGFERETELIEIARTLLPDIDFVNCNNLSNISTVSPVQFDFSMTCTVLQHLTDDHCSAVIHEIKKITSHGWVLLIEKTEDILTTQDIDYGNKFLSRARPVSQYEELMKPFILVRQESRVLEATYNNPAPGTCMLFKSAAA